jgi:hypothetical protein
LLFAQIALEFKHARDRAILAALPPSAGASSALS